MWKQYFKLIIANIEDKKIRSFLTVLGVLIGVVIIIILFSLGNAMQNGVEAQFAKLGIKSIRVIPGGLFGPPSGTIGLDKNLQHNIESVRGVNYAQPILLDFANVEFNKEAKFIAIESYDVQLGEKGFADTDTKIEIGRYFKSSDKDVIIIGHKVANSLYKKNPVLKNSLTIAGRSFRIIGVFAPTGANLDNNVFMPLETAREVFNKPDLTNVFVVQINPGYDIEKVAVDIKAELMKKFKDKDAFQVFTPAQLIAQIKSILGAVQVVLTAIATISLIVGAIGIMNSMFTSVLERTRDIGVMRAVGATKKEILILFLFESGMIGLIGGVIGIILGVSVTYLTAYLVGSLGVIHLVVKIGWDLILFSLGFSFLVGLISGVIPAIRAASLQPVEALRYE